MGKNATTFNQIAIGFNYWRTFSSERYFRSFHLRHRNRLALSHRVEKDMQNDELMNYKKEIIDQELADKLEERGAVLLEELMACGKQR